MVIILPNLQPTLPLDLGEEIQPVDLFPRTTHVETVVLLSKLCTEHHIEVDLDLGDMDLTPQALPGRVYNHHAGPHAFQSQRAGCGSGVPAEEPGVLNPVPLRPGLWSMRIRWIPT